MYLPNRQDTTTDDHEGACDVIVARHKDGSLGSTPFIVRFADIIKTKPVSILINGEKIKTKMHVNERNEGYFELTEQELPDASQRGGIQRFLDPRSQGMIALHRH
jgi:phosphatidate phosphatase PAH1